MSRSDPGGRQEQPATIDPTLADQATAIHQIETAHPAVRVDQTGTAATAAIRSHLRSIDPGNVAGSEVYDEINAIEEKTWTNLEVAAISEAVERTSPALDRLPDDSVTLSRASHVVDITRESRPVGNRLKTTVTAGANRDVPGVTYPDVGTSVITDASARVGERSLRGRGDPRTLAELIEHEIGHAEPIQDAIREQYVARGITPGGPGAVSRRGRESPSEDFAESFRVYFDRPVQMAIWHPRRYAAVRAAVADL